jgi:hypothetical protein
MLAATHAQTSVCGIGYLAVLGQDIAFCDSLFVMESKYRVQFMDDRDPFAVAFAEPTRPLSFVFESDCPLVNQIDGLQKQLRAPHDVLCSPFVSVLCFDTNEGVHFTARRHRSSGYWTRNQGHVLGPRFVHRGTS